MELSKTLITENITDVSLDDFTNIYNLCLQMECLCEESNGVGLSAVQVGVPWRVFVIKSDGKNPLIETGNYGYFLNCNYEPVHDEKIVSMEGCLSIKSNNSFRFFHVDRYKEIRLFGTQIKNGSCEKIDCNVKFSEQGIVFQHEIDHCYGKSITSGKETFIW